MDSIQIIRSIEDGPRTVLEFDIQQGDARLMIRVHNEATQHVIARDELDAAVDALRRSPIPAFPGSAEWALASGYELRLRCGPSESAYSWIMGAPAGWAPLETFVAALFAIAHRTSAFY
jgi:hypothetical protein